MLGKKKKPLTKKALQRLKNRRLQIIMEARRIHDKAVKKAKGKNKEDDTPLMGGSMTVKSMEEEDIAFALGQATTKAIVMGGNALEKLKSRAKKLKRSKSSHLKKLKKAKGTMKARGRS